MANRTDHRADRVQRVHVYKAWLRARCAGKTPPIPSDTDFRVWRDETRATPHAAALTPRRDDCPACGARRHELVVAPARFYCPACGVGGPGPAPLRVGSQLAFDQETVAA